MSGGGGGGGGGGVLREILARFGFEVDHAKLVKADLAMGGMIGKLKTFGAALAGTAFLNKMRHWVSETASVGKEIRNSSLALGVSTSDLQQWRAVAERAGVEAGALSMGFGLLQRKALDAARGGASAAMFRRLGVEVKNAAGELKTPAQLFEEVGFAIAALPNATERTGTALEFFGRAGRQFVPIFAQGREKVAEMRAELGEFGAELSDEQLAKLKEYSGQVHALGLFWEGLKFKVVFAILPMFTAVTGKLEEWARAFNRSKAAMGLLQVTLVALSALAVAAAVKFVAAWVAGLWPVLLVGAGLLAIYAVIEDIQRAASGKSSLIAFLMNATGVAQGLKDVLLGIKEAAIAAYEAVTGKSLKRDVQRAAGMGAGGTSVTFEQNRRRLFRESAERVGTAAGPGNVDLGTFVPRRPVGRLTLPAAAPTPFSPPGFSAPEASRVGITGVRRGAPTVIQHNSTAVHVTTAATDPEETARAVERHVVAINGREREEAMAALSRVQVGR